MTAAVPAKALPASPPSPPRHFFFGHLPELVDILGFYSRSQREYGDVVQLDLAGWTSFLVSHPDAIETVLVTNHRNFIKHTFFWRHVTTMFGKGLLTSEGSHWVQQRKLIQPAFHRDRINSYGSVMVASTERILEGWRDGQTRDVHADMMLLTMDIVVRTLFGSGVSAEDAAAVSAAFNVAIDEIAVRFRRPFKIPDWIPVPSNVRFNRAVRELDRLMYSLIRARRTSPERGNDLLSMLVDVRDENGEGMSEKQLRDEAITLFLAGHETTAIALSWTWYLLSEHPEVKAKLHEELDRVLGGRAPATEDLPRLEYTNRVILESMRLYPPAYAFGREALADCEVGGYRVPKGASVFMMPWILHRDARWFPSPETFDPDRWTEAFTRGLPAFAYLPFGGGPRRGIGNTIAMMEAVLALATMARRFDLTLVPGHRVEPFASITLRPKYGMKMSVRARYS
jgi:cytochrome P450